MHELHTDLREVLDESPRYWLSLIEWLPDTGALAAAIQGGREFRGWGLDRYMAADRWDMHMAEVSGKKNSPQYPRPAEKKKAQHRTLRSMFPRR